MSDKERERFEKWQRSFLPKWEADKRLVLDSDGEYLNIETENNWQGWLYRAKADQMTEARAREILDGLIRKDGGLADIEHQVNWDARDSRISLGGHFSVEQLKAFVFWMENKSDRI